MYVFISLNVFWSYCLLFFQDLSYQHIFILACLSLVSVSVLHRHLDIFILMICHTWVHYQCLSLDDAIFVLFIHTFDVNVDTWFDLSLVGCYPQSFLPSNFILVSWIFFFFCENVVLCKCSSCINQFIYIFPIMVWKFFCYHVQLFLNSRGETVWDCSAPRWWLC